MFLISNDDGYQAKGIATLVSVARTLGDVVVVAPEHHQSGTGSAITVGTPLRARQVKSEPGFEVFAVNGTPTDCMKLAFSHLLDGRTPDLVLTGVNHGYNIGVSTLYSGTMGAAMEGAVHGVTSIGFSYDDYDPNADFSPCLPWIERVIKAILANKLPKGVCLNVNIPRVPEILGIKVTSAAMGRWDSEYERRIDPHGRPYYWLTGHYRRDDPEDDTTDLYWLERGWVAATPCMVDQTAYNLLDKIKL